MMIDLRPFRVGRLASLRAFVQCVPTLSLLVLVVVVFGLMLYGCSQPNRYRTLSFFFDGVPRPEGWPQEQFGRDGVPIDPKLVDLAPSLTKGPTFYHKPYLERQCFDCHDRQTNYDAMETGGPLCQRCHEDYFEIEPNDWWHGPVANGDCGICHEAHKSPNKGLLTESQPDLCLQCHDPGFIQTDPFHAQLVEPICSDCHDPHAAGNRLLLADSRTYKRRDDIIKVEQSAHAIWTQEDCVRCHDAEQSNQLTSDVAQVCMNCHEKAERPVGVYEHEAVLQGKCTACHTPHRSTRPHLIRPNAEQSCYTCHDPQELKGGQHPNVTRVDCLICHRGHDSKQLHLLRDSVAQNYVDTGGTP